MYSGKFIKNARKAKGLKALYIARKANISNWHLSRIENDMRKPGLETLEALAGAIGVEVGEFFRP